jgi:hypothetical protein
VNTSFVILTDSLKGRYQLPMIFHLGVLAAKWEYGAPYHQNPVVIWSLPQDMLEKLVAEIEACGRSDVVAAWKEPDKDHKLMGVVLKPTTTEGMDGILDLTLNLRVSDMQLAG